MGYALAEAARDAGHDVLLISGPVCLPEPAGIECIRVITAREMFETVAARIAEQDVAVFAAAVADYRPAQVARQKLKKTADELTIKLERTEDILGSARAVFGFQGFLVGFAAETENLIAHAQDKLLRKKCDLVVANDVSQEGAGFDSAENEVILCLPGLITQPLARTSKTDLARQLIRVIEQRCSFSSSRSTH